MTKIKFLFVFVAIVFATSFAQLAAQVSTWDGTHTPWTHGTGTEGDPFLIENAQQLAYLTYRVNNGLDAAGGHVSNSAYHYKLMTDIDLNGSEEFQWTPIGYYNSSSDYQCFGGHFDGNGHSISGLYVNKSYAGFFGYTDGVTVKNLAVSGITISGSYAGGIIGKAVGNIDIQDCSTNFSGNISSSSYNCGAGGIVGYAGTGICNIINCYNNGNVKCIIEGGQDYNNGNNSGGGIVGCVNGATTISNCYNIGSVRTGNRYVVHAGDSDDDFYNYCGYGGGIVGNDASTTLEVTNCYNTGNVSDGVYSGGIVGKSNGTTNISNCYNTGRLTGENNGGIACGATITNSYYLNTCCGYSTYGGSPMSADAMRSDEFVDILNNDQNVWMKDYYYINQGYPLLQVDRLYVMTLDASNVSQTQATLNGIAFSMGSINIISQGFEYKLTSDAEFQVVNTEESGNMSYTVTDLSPNGQYIYRTFCTSSENVTQYGSTKTFRTIPPWDGSYSPWTQGTGTEDDPYLIENAQQLAYLAYRINNGFESNSKYYKVVADIYLYGSGDLPWTPIGNSQHSFGGHFDGGNYTIHGLYVNVTENNGDAGLFGYASFATIKNTNVVGTSISISRNVGHAGGIVGYANSTFVSNCSNSCQIIGGSSTGGIVGSASGSTISQCYNAGTISGGSTNGSSNCSGGIIGGANTTNINNCYNKGNVSSTGYNDTFENGYSEGSYYYIMAGGILGGGGNFFVVDNCYSIGCCSATNNYYGGRAGCGAIVGYCAHYGEGYYYGYPNYDEQIHYDNQTTNCSYLNTCNVSNTYGGTAMSAEAMRDANFVNLLNGNSCIWQQDIEPFVNDGYPILTPMQNEAYTENPTDVADVSATLHGLIEVSNATITSKGFEYKKVSESEYSIVDVTTEGNTLTSHLSGLTPNTTYEYRAFVNVAECEYTSYGENMQFTVSYLNADTIPIYDTEMLQWVADMCNSGTTFEGKYIKLMNHIVLTLNQPNNMTSIGSYPDHPFKGTFDGNGKLITNLYIDQPNSPYQGFFGYTLDANLYNVGLVNITASGRNYTGGMVAYAENTNMRDCYVNGGSLFALSYCGGLVGYQTPGTNSIISGCYNTCTVSGNHYVGGLLGYSDQGTVRNSYVASSVAAQGEAVGSIIGGANEVLMYQCYFSSEITGQENAIGENNFKSNEGMTNEQMRDPQFVATLNQGLTVPVWKGDYEQPINNGFPILKWQYSDIETCGAPENLTSIINGNNITLIWTGEENVDYYIVEYGLAGEQAQTETTTRNTISFNYEQPGSYYWRVKSVCPFGESNFVNGENVVIGGIEEIGGIQQIGIYPNPASESVTIQSEGQNDLEQINIFDVNGRMVMSESATGQIHRLDISNLQQGIYFVKVQTSDGYMTNKKLIVQ